MEQTSELKTYRGNCHCGNFRFSISIPDLTNVRKCDCSICTKLAYMWIYPIAPENLVIERGEGSLTTYQFGGRTMSHFFCSKCGSSVMGVRHNTPSGDALGINARMMKDVDPNSLEFGELFPGSELPSKYEMPALSDWKGEVEEGLVVYSGACHCVAVTYAVKTKSLDEQKVLECNCSLCSRNGDLWIYPSKNAVQVRGNEHLTDYDFLSQTSLHSFCSICGTSVLVKATEEDDDVVPLNVRTFAGIELGSLMFNKYDGRRNDPQYSV